MKKIVFLLGLLLAVPLIVQGAEKKVTLATLEWPPYIGSELPGHGYVYELVVTAFKRSGYKAEITFYPWARSVNLVAKGNIDVLFPEYYDKEREIAFEFSKPFPGGPVGLFKRKEFKVKWLTSPLLDQSKALRELSQYRFGVVRGYINTEEFDKATFLHKEDVVSDELNLKKLSAKRIDFIFIDKFVALHLLETREIKLRDELEFMEPAMENKRLYLAFSRGDPDYKAKLAAFNEGLQRIKDDGTMDMIMKRHGF